MVRKSKLKRVGGDFDFFINNLSDNLTKNNGKKPSYRQITDDLSNWLKEENLDKIIERRYKTRGGRLF